jgi:hypothetical protein
LKRRAGRQVAAGSAGFLAFFGLALTGLLRSLAE